MKKQNGNIGKRRLNKPGRDDNRGFLLTPVDAALFDDIGQCIMGRMDLEEVRNDPSLENVEGIVKDMIADYNKKTRRSDNEKFIRDAFEGISDEGKVAEEISKIKLEISKTDIDKLTADWVKEWHEKKQSGASQDPKSKEIRNYITSSLNDEVSEPEVKYEKSEVSLHGSTFNFRRFVLPLAAALLGAIVLIKVLLPTSNPDKIYSSFYEPFGMFSSVTRDVKSNSPDGYNKAIEMYQAGNYQTAAIAFSNVILNDTSFIEPRFFLGVTQIAMGEYDQAINLLSTLTSRQCKYSKESEWYLGLACLRTGEKDKAAECFRILAESKGFYSERAEKILRRLK